jgi:membrane protein DedA with SNARE-associated domain
VEAFLERWGLPAVFLASVVDGDVGPLLAGVLVHLGLHDFVTTLAVTTAALLSADTAWYAVGRRGGPALRASRLYRRVGRTIERVADRVGPWELVLSRLVYGTRTASMLFWGVRGLGLRTFLAIDAVGAFLWSLALVWVGWGLSAGVTTLTGEVKALERRLLGAVLIAVLVVAGVRLLRRRRRQSA